MVLEIFVTVVVLYSTNQKYVSVDLVPSNRGTFKGTHNLDVCFNAVSMMHVLTLNQ